LRDKFLKERWWVLLDELDELEVPEARG